VVGVAVQENRTLYALVKLREARPAGGTQDGKGSETE